MRLFTILFLIVVSAEAKKRRNDNNQTKIYDGPRKVEGTDPRNLGDNPDRDTFQYPVPFGHIYKEGFGDPRGEFKQPIDMAELDSVYLKDGPLAKELIEKQGKGYQRVQKYYPREDTEILSHKDLSEEHFSKDENSTKMFWDFAGMLKRNLHYPIGQRKRPVQTADVGPDYTSKSKYFSAKSFGLKMYEPKFNFTTCDEFGRNAKFHPNDIVNIDWVPFYIWGSDITGKLPVARVHKFTYPTKKLVAKFKDELGSHLNKTINWEQPKLILRNDFTHTLLVAADRKGLFDGIPYHEMTPTLRSSGVKMPMISIRLKLLSPYLAMMYCDHKQASIMAVSGKEPATAKKKKSEAALLKLRGPGLPVRRDLNAEWMEVRAKKREELMKEQSKFIEVFD